ncbi:MAG: biotin/lipoyl-binding protein [Desulfobacter sp.]|nr:MAG: biotin/lipoyl-binding protein [Desulfobacter sp.]
MEYNLDINGESRTLDVRSQTESGAEVRMGDASYDLAFSRMDERKICLDINGCQVNAWVEKTRGGSLVILNGKRYFILDKDAQEQSGGTRKKSGAGQEPDTVTPPMPAVVIQVPVSQGDWVEKGDTVVVVSAMKMETSLKAPYGGKITRIGVCEGDKVMPGDILADIEKAEAGEAA